MFVWEETELSVDSNISILLSKEYDITILKILTFNSNPKIITA